MTKNHFLIPLAILAVIVVGIFSIGALKPSSSGSLGGAQLVQNSNPIFTNGLRAGLNTIVQVITSTGGVSPGGGAAISKTLTGTASYNPPSLATSATSTTNVALPGATVNDTCLATISTATTTGLVTQRCYISSAGTSTVIFTNVGAVVDLATGTLTVADFQW